MTDRLNLTELNKGFDYIKIGFLTQDIIDLLKLNRQPCDILLWEDRFKYIEKHKKDFDNIEDFNKHIELIPDIIKRPDYVGKHPKDNSIQYIKQINKLMIVGIRLKEKGNIVFRTAYPLSEAQLEDYIKCGTVCKINR